ncbi:hypothetical protein HNQ44_002578 [Planomicrobium koreense]|uniref:Uncharacterized protein n=1 Tax=Planococcus koreensis TaxID=112331 RepID=A0A7W8CV63_9BACL|nr:hypothetical protein [Planococcus koreensis]MBB5181113.1 hypothetical protein [Planococcus koreensis]
MFDGQNKKQVADCISGDCNQHDFLRDAVAFTMLPNITNVLIFQALILVIVSYCCCGLSNLPAFFEDLFGTKHLGAIHRYLLTTWSMGGIIGPAIVSQI